MRRSLPEVTNSTRRSPVTLYHGDGSGQYVMPLHLAAQASATIDIGMLIGMAQPDANGNLIPNYMQEGSVAAYFTGTIMPLVGQITVTNPRLSLVHESVMVEHDPGRSDIPSGLNGVCWGLSGREGRVMVSNTSASPQTAQVYLDFQGQRHALPTPLAFLPYETKTLDIAQLLASLGVAPGQAPEGGITIIQNGPQPALIANGRITDAATGFSSTMDFPSPEMEHASALHASGLPIGTPTPDSPFAGAGTFVPHVIVRNLTGSPQAASITVEYPQAAAAGSNGALPGGTNQSPSSGKTSAGKGFIPAPPVPGDADHHPEWGAGTGTTVGTVTLGPLPLGAYTSVDFSLAAALAQLPLPLPYCSVRIQYSGMPGSVQAQVTSVESESNLIVDSHVQNEGNGWAGSGANPWQLDENTESILFLSNESDKPARIGFSVTANSVHYYLTKLRLNPHETRVIDLRKLRDAQLPDFKKNLIPASATDGSVKWNRVDNVAVMGRLMVINRQAGMASNYDCCVCPCPCYTAVIEQWMDVSGPSAVTVNQTAEFTAYAEYYQCTEDVYEVDVTTSASWTEDNPNVITVDSSGDVTGDEPGTTNVDTSYSGCGEWDMSSDGLSCFCAYDSYGYGAAKVTVGPTPYAAVVLKTVTQGAASCGSGLAGWSRTVTMQLQDQNGNAIAVSGITMADQISVGSPNDLGGQNTNTGQHPTDSSGTWPDTYYICSSACPGSTGETDAIQSWTWSGAPLPHSNYVVYKCSSITSDGR